MLAMVTDVTDVTGCDMCQDETKRLPTRPTLPGLAAMAKALAKVVQGSGAMSVTCQLRQTAQTVAQMAHLRKAKQG
jgi:hypothetical protein